ncbi:MAG TPA: NAD(P)/FAD-dependent oxidoreductase [Campylobacterales bacterium]|nr:NAD(P)/FAD-dependent oxidoreductase [Campylobacterales bacterium]
MKNCDVLIIGGGPAGSIAGANLAQKGFSVEIIEKVDFPRFVIGESLLPQCNEILAKNNLLEKVTKKGFILKAGAMFINDAKEVETYHFRENIGEPYNTSFQVKREEFDHELLLGAAEFGANVQHGVEVTEYQQEQQIVSTVDRNGNKEEYQARFVLDASGYGRVLPRLLDLDIPSELKTRQAVFTRVENDIRPEGELAGYITIFIHGDNDAWIWVIPFADGITSVGIVSTEKYFEEMNMSEEDFWNHVITTNPNAKERFKNAKKVRPVGKIGGYSSNVKTMHGKGFALAGNATEFLDPVFSSGVTLALVSGDLAADLIAKELNGETVDWQTDYEDYMMIGIDVFRDFVNTWYDGRLQRVFFSPLKQDMYTRSISSILSGYVWNKKNVFVGDSTKKIDLLLKMIDASTK